MIEIPVPISHFSVREEYQNNLVCGFSTIIVIDAEVLDWIEQHPGAELLDPQIYDPIVRFDSEELAGQFILKFS
jgi:hypothetical protein